MNLNVSIEAEKRYQEDIELRRLSPQSDGIGSVGSMVDSTRVSHSRSFLLLVLETGAYIHQLRN